MGLLFADRSRRGPDPFLRWKVRLFLAGAVVALLGMARDSSWLLGVAVAFLGAGFVLRFIPRDGEEDCEEDYGEDEEEGEEEGSAAST